MTSTTSNRQIRGVAGGLLQAQEIFAKRRERQRELQKMAQSNEENLWNRGYKERQFSQGAGEFELQQGLRERQFQQAMAESEDKRRSSQIQDRRNAYEVVNQKRKLQGNQMTPSERVRNFETSQQFGVDPQTGTPLRPDQIYSPRWGAKSSGGTEFEDVLTTLGDQGGGSIGNKQAQRSQGYSVGDIVDGPDGRKYRVLGGDPNDPDVELVE